MIFLSSPFWHHDPQVRGTRRIISYLVFSEHTEAWKDNPSIPPMFSPLIYTSSLENFTKMSEEQWRNYFLKFLEKCSEIHILMLPLWEKSEGLNQEAFIARELGLKKIEIPFKDIEQRFPREASWLVNLHKALLERI